MSTYNFELKENLKEKRKRYQINKSIQKKKLRE
jgi:hypothetical protein